MGYDEPLFGVTAADDRYALPHAIPAGWDRLWGAVHAVKAVHIYIDPINLAAVWTGYGPTEVGSFLGAIKDELGGLAGALLVGHTGKAAAKSDEPSALDILGSVAWKDRARCAFIARSSERHIELHLVKANYAPRHAWAYTATPTGASNWSTCTPSNARNTPRWMRRCSSTSRRRRSPRRLRRWRSSSWEPRAAGRRRRSAPRSNASWRPDS